MDNVLFYPKNTDDNKVTVPAEICKNIAESYAPDRKKSSSGFYAARRGGGVPTVFDTWYYKCAEFASAIFLHEKFDLPLLSADTKIYKASQKSWSPDLMYRDVNFMGKHFDELKFHNKSVTRKIVAKGFPESFMFQNSNKDGRGGHDKILDSKSDNDYCIFVYVPYDDIVTNKADFYIRGIMPWTFIKENNLLEDPKKKEFIGIKLCVYTESIRRVIEEEQFAEMIK